MPGLKDKDEAVQVHTLIYSMGDKTNDILKSFGLSQDDLKKYDTVKGKIDGHFVKKHKTVYERARFNQHVQEEGESADQDTR